MRRLLVTMFLLPLVVAACGDGGDDGDDGDAAAGAPTTAAPTTTAAAGGAAGTQEAGAATVELRETSFGKVLVDAEGMSLYLFTRDSAGKSACEGQCLQTWPPLLVDGAAAAGEGVDQAKLSTFARSDGAMQVAYAGKPLYSYAPDTKAGDTNGQGVGGVWFLVGADGEAIKTTG